MELKEQLDLGFEQKNLPKNQSVKISNINCEILPHPEPQNFILHQYLFNKIYIFFLNSFHYYFILFSFRGKEIHYIITAEMILILLIK